MMADARFKDGGEAPLRLLAQKAEDLTVLSALVQDAVRASSARLAIQGRAATKSAIWRALASARATSAGRPPIPFAHSSATR